MTPVYIVCAALLATCLPTSTALPFAKVSDKDKSRYEITGKVLPYVLNNETITVELHAVPLDNDTSLVSTDFLYAYCDGSDAVVQVTRLSNRDGKTVDYVVPIPANANTLSVLGRKRCLRCSTLVRKDTVSFCVNATTVYEVKVSRELDILKMLLSIPDHSPHIMWISVSFLMGIILVFVAMIVVVIMRDKRINA